jgi:hypothetical protein
MARYLTWFAFAAAGAFAADSQTLVDNDSVRIICVVISRRPNRRRTSIRSIA